MSESNHPDQCRIFVSRKKSDAHVVDHKISKSLSKLAPGRLKFFDDSGIKAGDEWRKKIRSELRDADILLLVLTEPAKHDFDWCLYEAGLFEDLTKPKSKDRKPVVCLLPNGVDIPSQLDDLQVVPADEENILRFLMALFHDQDFTHTDSPLNPELEEEDLVDIAAKIIREINGRSNGLERFEYGNRWIQLVLPRGVDASEDAVEVNSSPGSLLDLFDLAARPPDAECWTWGQLADRAQLEEDPRGFNVSWINELKDEIAAKRTGSRSVRQLTGRFLARDGELYRPEIEVYRSYKDGRLTVDVTFSAQIQDSWIKKASAPVALAAMVGLATRIRHELIEPYLLKLRAWKRQDSIEKGFANLQAIIALIEREGFFINRLTRGNIEEAFTLREAEGIRLAELGQEFAEVIQPALERAIEEKSIEDAKYALRLWRDNNAAFLKIAIDVYSQLLHLERAVGVSVVAA